MPIIIIRDMHIKIKKIEMELIRNLDIDKYHNLKSGKIFTYGYIDNDELEDSLEVQHPISTWVAYKRKSDNSWCIYIKNKEYTQENLYPVLSGQMVSNPEHYLDIDEEVEKLYKNNTLVK